MIPSGMKYSPNLAKNQYNLPTLPDFWKQVLVTNKKLYYYTNTNKFAINRFIEKSMPNS